MQLLLYYELRWHLRERDGHLLSIYDDFADFQTLSLVLSHLKPTESQVDLLLVLHKRNLRVWH